MRSVYTLFVFLLCGITGVQAQVHTPYKWSFAASKGEASEATLYLTAALEEGWHIYSQFIEEGGPLPTTFTFSASEDYTLINKVNEESESVKSFDHTFLMDIAWFKQTAVFSQKVKLHVPTTTIKGKVEFMVCTDEMCLPPEVVEFNISVNVNKPERKQQKVTPAQEKQKNEKRQSSIEKVDTTRFYSNVKSDQVSDSSSLASGEVQPKVVAGITPATTEPASETENTWSIFILGFIGGFVALLMPCIFPMIPFTVGYFMKRGGSRENQIGIACLYGFSIIVIYVAFGLLITILFGADALNSLSTNGVFNFAFFLLLVIFAASFLGAFEIALPSSWINKADAQSDRKGFAGIFFMAATLALVSFSCTGPIIGTLLVETFRSDGLLKPVMGMLGFSLALALPFTLFAMFPSLLKGLPKSGGWLNSVKVVLGFLELALALKFLSNVDLAYHWEWFDREVFLVLWIIIFGLMGFYLLGKIKLPHDTEVSFISPIRLFIAIVSLAFTLYMIPGLWGAPLKVIAAFLPPQSTQDFDLHSASLFPVSFTKNEYRSDKKYGDLFEAPHGLDAFFDFDEGIAYARKVNKPVMIDFTGHACVNCRKMEMNVWSDQKVLEKLRHDFVLIQLYVDDNTPLPEHEQVTSVFSGKKIKTIGNKWSDLQAASFNTNSQPYYVLLSSTGKQLVTPQGADYDADRFSEFLMKGIKAFETSDHIN